MLDTELHSESASALVALDAPAAVDPRVPRDGAHEIPATDRRVLLVIDMSDSTCTALDSAEWLAADGSSVDLYYLWSASGHVTSADRVGAELSALGLEPGAIDRLDRVSALERRGILTVRGCVTREAHGGASLSTVAHRAGYDLVVLGLRRTPEESHRFRLHTFS